MSVGRPVRLALRLTDSPPEMMAEGRFLEAAQMLVDPIPAGLRATTTSGALLTGRFEDDGEGWLMEVPPSVSDEGRWPEIEGLLTLVLTTGWRRAGWVPLHAAGIVDGDRARLDGGATLVCAGSMGGKTTFTLAMVHRGWLALGDDKLLLGEKGGSPVVAAIKHMLNVDPAAAAAWFPELGDLSTLPEYSAWTPKRRVSLRSVRPSGLAFSARPRQLVELARSGGSQTQITTLSRDDTIAALLRQSVIPRDPQVARPIVQALGHLGQNLRGFRVEIGNDAYSDPTALDPVEAVLR